MTANPPLSPCGALVRAYDADRFRICLFLPEPLRERHFTLLAFNAEIARIPELVSEPMIGHIRFAWWREALDEIYAGKPVRKHEVAQPLAELIRAHNLPRELFDAMLNARQSILEGWTAAHTAELEGFAAATSAELLKLQLRAQDIADPTADAAAETIGTAYALVGLARAVPHYAQHKLRLVPPGDDREVIEKIIERAASLLKGSAKLKLKSELKWLNLYATTARHYAGILRKAGFEPGNLGAGEGRGRLAVRLVARNMV